MKFKKPLISSGFIHTLVLSLLLLSSYILGFTAGQSTGVIIVDESIYLNPEYQIELNCEPDKLNHRFEAPFPDKRLKGEQDV